MKLVVGLWNPWIKYDYTRHNIGFIFLDVYCKYNNLGNFLYENKFSSEILESNLNWEKVLFVKPQTYMNLSGKAIWALANFYKLDSKDILILYDDIDLPSWKIRLRWEWSAWWHNWIKDTIRVLWTDKFFRLKIWIWRPKNKEMLTPHVLWKLSSDEIKMFKEKEDEVFSIINKFIKD